jgi:hypothetical protein
MVTVNHCSRRQMAKEPVPNVKEMHSLESRTIPHDCACGSSVRPAMVENLSVNVRRPEFLESRIPDSLQKAS